VIGEEPRGQSAARFCRGRRHFGRHCQIFILGSRTWQELSPKLPASQSSIQSLTFNNSECSQYRWPSLFPIPPLEFKHPSIRSNMASSKPQSQLGQVLIDFSTNGAFPEEEAVSAAYAEPSALPSALVAVRDAKVALEVGSRFPFIV